MKKHLAILIFFASFALCSFVAFAKGDVMKDKNLSQAEQNKVRLMNYLRSEVWMQKTLAGQMDLTWHDSVDMLEKVYTLTNKYPALSGYDFMNIGLNWDGAKQTAEAINWWQNAKGTGKHGIVTFCWHWRDPAKKGGEFYQDKTSFRIPMKDGKLDTKSKDFKLIKRDLDLVATELLKLKKAGVPVLWRPMHEAGGDRIYNNPWFWWGASGKTKQERADAFVALYRYMHDYFSKEKKLDNLIWVWNGQVKEYYPGDEYVDIIGEDVYADVHDYQSQKSRFLFAKSYTKDDKMIALSENGVIPHPDNLKKDDARWLWFMVWNDATEKGTNSSNFWEGEFYNKDAHKKEVYAHKDVITLDELPDLTSYPL